jgi:effector-binding domain-containing protein
MKSEQSKLVKTQAKTWVFVSRRTGPGPDEIRASIESAFAELTEAIARGGVRTSGPPRARYHYRDGAQLGFDLGFPIIVNDEAAARRAGLKTGQTLSGEALMRVHKGPYEGLAGAYGTLREELKAKGLEGKGDTWEVYLNDPDNTPAANLLTQIYWPIVREVSA